MGWREPFLDPKKRTRIIAATLALGAFAGLPPPARSREHIVNVVLLSLWIGWGALSWAAWFQPDLSNALWIAVLIASLLAYWKLSLLLPLYMAALWKLWLVIRSNREARVGMRKLALLLLIAAPALVGARPAFAAETENKAAAPENKPAALSIQPKRKIAQPGDVVIPKYLSGYSLNDLTTCGRVDGIPWKFRSDGRKTRLILRDVMRLNSETKFFEWEVQQIMDLEGYVTYVFRHQSAKNRWESIVAKDAIYNRIIDTPNGPRLVQKVDLRQLISRPVLTFFHADGSTVSYTPGSAGDAILTIQLVQSSGGLSAPVFLRGKSCDRPGDEKNEPEGAGVTPQKKGAAPGAPPLPATPGISGGGGGED